METRGQITAEYILILAFLLVLLLKISSFLNESMEMEMAMSAARDGAIEGANINGLAIYPKDAYHEYETGKKILLQPSSVQIIKIDTIMEGYNESYRKYKIRLVVYAHLSRQMPVDCRESIGDRINYNVRKNICKTFKTENMTNIFFNPAFSRHYMFTTSDVRWV